MRKRLVSAILLGGNVEVPIGKDVGGTFTKVAACRSATQIGCVVAYSSFVQPPPSNALFGLVPGSTTLQVLCTNPASLAANEAAPLVPYVHIKAFPGPLGPFVRPIPEVLTPWESQPKLYTAHCRNEFGRSWLEIGDTGRIEDGRQRVVQSPRPHLGPAPGRREHRARQPRRPRPLTGCRVRVVSAGVTVLWRGENDSSERFRLHGGEDGGHVLEGDVVLVLDGAPASVSYRVEADADWLTRRVHVRMERGSDPPRELSIEADGVGRWMTDGDERADLYGCTDVDLGVTPSTNTLPIRRLADMAAGTAEQVRAAWVRFPELTVEVLDQVYNRLGIDRWLYRSGNDFQAELLVDDHGVVISYGEDHWKTVARS